jgi:hypothetical protein
MTSFNLDEGTDNIPIKEKLFFTVGADGNPNTKISVPGYFLCFGCREAACEN